MSGVALSKSLIQVRNLNAHYNIKGKLFHAVRDVSFEIPTSQTLGLVGESGCGKSTIGKLLLGLIPISSGEILYEGYSIKDMKKGDLFNLRKQCQMVFQDPYGSVNPRMTIEEIIKEPLQIFKIGTNKSRQEKVRELLSLVDLDESFANRYPHELSGGQRQRVGIARALAPDPKFLICDEPIAALDVSIQSQIINLLNDLQQKLGLTYLFISHDLAVVKYLASRILVMYCGEIIEIADTDDLYSAPFHPYTTTLLDSIPIPDPVAEKNRSRMITFGEPPNAFEEIKGCPFASRCQKKLDCCSIQKPIQKEVGNNHQVVCHLYTQEKSKNTTSLQDELEHSKH